MLLGLGGCTGSPPVGQPTYVDLTHPFDEHTIFWPTEEGFSLERAFHGITPGGYFYSEQSIPIFENVARIGELPPRGFTILALPMKIKGGSGGPLRILARLRSLTDPLHVTVNVLSGPPSGRAWVRPDRR